MAKKKPLKVIAGAPDRPAILGDIQIPCYVLEDETRVLSQRGLTSGLGLNPDAGFRMPQFLTSRAIKPFVSKDLAPALESPIVFQNPGGGGVAYGYPPEVLEMTIDAVMNAELAGALPPRYAAVAERARALNGAFRRGGIIGWIDEATGYQEIRDRKALRAILEQYIAKEWQPWTRTFPPEFYEQIFRLKGWPGPDGVKRPGLIGRYTNDIVYDRLPEGVLDELRRKNPTVRPGQRRRKHHQWLTGDVGHPALRDHLIGVMALMRAAPNWDAFKRTLVRSYKKRNENVPLALGDDEDDHSNRPRL